MLKDSSKRQFWIKPWGSRDFPEQPDAQPDTQFFASPQLEITFLKAGTHPQSKKEIFFLCITSECRHMDAPKLVCVTESNSTPAYATTEQLQKEAWRTRLIASRLSRRKTRWAGLLSRLIPHGSGASFKLLPLLMAQKVVA